MKQAPIEWTGAGGVAENAREFLPGLASEFFAAGRQAQAGEVELESLHRFRLRTKRFRYTLELFEPVYGPGLPERLERLKAVQNLLGSINDCVESEALLRGMRGTGKKARLRSVLRLIAGRREERLQRFLAFWNEDFDRPGEEEAWRQFLAEPAGPGERDGEA